MADVLHEFQSPGFDLRSALVAVEELKGDRYAPGTHRLPNVTETPTAQALHEAVTGEDLRIWLQGWLGHVRTTHRRRNATEQCY